ncbi:thioredoxin family protein [Candidatus Nitronereus thalassa]|uniref:Thioredoxin domain-containing protein n=1 Tax=Candidatus Nitronereus thalassa TaxID=3020898 RepID=A0ABU3KAD5_9BACT|nr:thioredoxin domain-containing protein [Candidatus Nitronereus thalassa]MDT7043357.1 thioredoxin domain-containing protein [Candidatus Nitronereus thalassa]
MIPEISDKEFDNKIGQFGIPILIEFWKPGCSHCQSLLKELEGLQEETRNRLAIFKMNVEENHLIPGDLEIHSLPALALFVKGEFQRFIGGIGRKAEIRAQLSLWLDPNEPEG